ncbi:hypothetical protein Nepgr_032600 [Nepenthes gracilis]|uniref:Uncharacterized protein n=1 Tax=Nepenthes gracilis TaxID=150966 RepID=A0AAD3TJR9_NEPGR|nr:hypothetical protein Nepgr_032600 [Nepenthes gracilis]
MGATENISTGYLQQAPVATKNSLAAQHCFPRQYQAMLLLLQQHSKKDRKQITVDSKESPHQRSRASFFISSSLVPAGCQSGCRCHLLNLMMIFRIVQLRFMMALGSGRLVESLLLAYSLDPDDSSL